MKTNLKLLLFLLSVLLASCSKELDNERKFDIKGKAQKGPFKIGTNVTISELDNDLNPTGKVYFSTIMNHEGYFDLPDIEFASNYVQLKVEGDYFEEYHGYTTTNQPITLFCIVDLSENDITNINLLTHLEMDRIIQFKNEGLSFIESKQKAQNEILKNFNIENVDFINSENLDISGNTDNDAILLAITLIIQGSKVGSNLTEFLTNIRNDIYDNGIIDSEGIQTRLISQSKLLDKDRLRDNLHNYFINIGEEIEIPPFERYIDTFNIKSSYNSIANYSFPNSTNNGINLLALDSDTIVINKLNSYSIALQTGINSMIDANVMISKIEGEGLLNVENNSNWEINYNYVGEFIGEENTPYDGIQCLLYRKPNTMADLNISFIGEGLASFQIDIGLFEYNMTNYIDVYIKWDNR